MSEPFIAEIRIFAGNYAPRGWAFCNGQLLPIAQNTSLYSLIGTTYGGDGMNTTGLPNLQGRVPVHAGTGPGLTARRLGERGGSLTATVSEAEMATHNHTANGTTNHADQRAPANNLVASSVDRDDGFYVSSTNTGPFGNLTSIGGSQPHANVQPFLAINFIIALTGLYPSRT